MATYRELLAQVRSEIDEISTIEAQERLASSDGSLFVDVREADERNTYGLVRDIVDQVLRSYGVPPSIVETFIRVFYGAMTSAGMSVASAEDPEAAGREVETVIGIVLAGLRQLVESGVDLLDPTSR